MDGYIYISGKIGEEVISDATRQKFARAEEMLNKHFNPDYCTVVNPASEAYQDTMNQAFQWRELVRNLPDILLYDLNWLRTCKAIYMLEDWQQSNGANLELDFARATGMKVYWQSLEDAQVFRDDGESAEDVWLPIEEEEDGV